MIVSQESILFIYIYLLLIIIYIIYLLYLLHFICVIFIVVKDLIKDIIVFV